MLIADPQEFIESIRKDRVDLFDRVFRSGYDTLCRFANSFLEDPDHSEEVVQAVFVYIWENRHDLELHSSLRSYLFTAVRNRCLNEIKRQKVRDKHHQGIQATAAESYQENKIERQELSERITNAINSLPTERQKIFKMSKLEGKKYKEIAEELNISVKTVEGQMGKALKHLRAELGGVVPMVFYLGKWCLHWFLNG